MQKVVFLDRDGVLNKSLVVDGKPYAPLKLSNLEILPGVAEALEEFKKLGYLNLVVTNQPDIAAGRLNAKDLKEMHDFLSMSLAIDCIESCPHTDEDDCYCRKPAPGMLLNLAKRFDIDFSSSWMIGDRWKDIVAGQSAGCQCIFIDYGYDERVPPQPFFKVNALLDATRIISSWGSE